jgi:hypothetical protein
MTIAVRSGRTESRLMCWVAAVLASLVLPFMAMVDLDGDATTVNLPDVVLVEPARLHTVADRNVDEVVSRESLTRRAGTRVLKCVMRAERWTRFLLRFHHRVAPDIPI